MCAYRAVDLSMGVFIEIDIDHDEKMNQQRVVYRKKKCPSVGRKITQMWIDKGILEYCDALVKRENCNTNVKDMFQMTNSTDEEIYKKEGDKIKKKNLLESEWKQDAKPTIGSTREHRQSEEIEKKRHPFCICCVVSLLFSI